MSFDENVITSCLSIMVKNYNLNWIHNKKLVKYIGQYISSINFSYGVKSLLKAKIK